jgi:hypothetical protein
VSTFAQETDNDLTLVQGQLVLVTDVAEEAAIELGNKFRFVQGEYFLDTRQGVPYFGFVFVKNPDVLLIRQLFRSVILAVEGVDRIIDMNVDFDTAARHLDFSFRALAANGKIISGGAGVPFIVEPS